MDERRILWLVAAVQFVNVLDFVMVMPLGPDFAKALDIPTSQLGLIGGSYTFAAAFAGIGASFFLDRFDRRKALAVTLLGLVAGPALAGFATGMRSLMLARVIAGAFGGPATSVALAIIADVVPNERRGRALGFVMGAFSVASVLGVPAGLELARLGGWQTPFFAVAGLGTLVCGAAITLMPPMTLHITRKRESTERVRPLREFMADPAVAVQLATFAMVTVGSFLLIPNLSTYLQFNLHYPRERIGLLYMVGGVVSFATMRAAGRLVDLRGAFVSALIGNLLFMVVLVLIFVVSVPAIPVIVLFSSFMIANGFRFVALNTVGTKVPFANERARYMSTQSAVQHIAAGFGAIASSFVLVEQPDKSLAHIGALAVTALILSLPMPFLVGFVSDRIAARPTPTPEPAPVR